MIIKSNIIEAVNSLVGAKQRSILALIGIIFGIGSVIAMVSVGSIVQKEALRQFLEMGTDTLIISKAYDTDGTKNKSRQGITVKNALDIPANCPSIKKVAPYTTLYENFKFSGKKLSVPAIGVTTAFFDINKLHIKEGRFIHELDESMFFCVIGEKVEKKLRSFGAAKLLGTRIFFKEKQFIIAGVIKEARLGGMRPYQINEGIMIPISTLQRLSSKAKIEAIMARIHTNFGSFTADKQIKQYYTHLNGLRVDVRSAEELIAQMKKQMQLFTLLLGTIGSISLIVGGVGVMNVMLVSVTERTKEIGIRRALGARQGDIQFQFLVESVMLCILGGIIGTGIGVVVSYLISYYAKWQFAVSYESIVLGVAVAVTVGVFFGFYPARQAAKLSPIMALRSD